MPLEDPVVRALRMIFPCEVAGIIEIGYSGINQNSTDIQRIETKTDGTYYFHRIRLVEIKLPLMAYGVISSFMMSVSQTNAISVQSVFTVNERQYPDSYGNRYSVFTATSYNTNIALKTSNTIRFDVIFKTTNSSMTASNLTFNGNLTVKGWRY